MLVTGLSLWWTRVGSPRWSSRASSSTEGTDLDQPWITLVWNDPVNLMSYVTYVFQSYFGYSREKSERLMLDVHQKGRAVVSTGSREKMEHDTEALQAYGLWATLQKDD